MKLSIVIDQLSTDKAGTENQVIKLVHGLAGRFEIELISLRESDWLSQAGPNLPCRVTIIELDGPVSPLFWIGLFRLWRCFRRQRPDVVHTFFPIANVVGVICARLAGVRAIASSRRDYGFWMSWRYLWATRFANRFVASIVCNSEQVKKLTVGVEGISPAHVTVIQNGIDVAQFAFISRNDELKESLGIPANHTVIGLVGNVRRIKRHDTLVAAVHELLLTRSDISLLFVGKDNGNLAEVMALVSDFDMCDRVFVAHANGNVIEYLSFTDIGVNCSESEGLSNAVIEYMAAGIPCVVSDGGGNVDLISDGISGLVFPVGDHHCLAAKLERMLDDKPLRRNCVDAARMKIHTQMSLPVILDEFDTLYRNLVEAAGDPACESR